MAQYNVSYKAIKTEEFKNFTALLKKECGVIYSIESTALPDKSQKIMNRIIGAKGLEGMFSYYSMQETIHGVTQTMLLKGHQLQDVFLINELNRYNCENTSGESLYERMKADITLLIALQGSGYYMSAFNDAENINGAFHAEAYKHIWRGVVEGFSKGSFGHGVDVAWKSKWKERYRRRAVALRNISLMLMLYLFGCYLSYQDIQCISRSIYWLLEAGYEWLDIPEEPETDLLDYFLVMDVPDVGFTDENIYMLDFYSKIETYKSAILKQYPNASEKFIQYVNQAENLPKKFDGFLVMPDQ